jgi:hypothetical protein
MIMQPVAQLISETAIAMLTMPRCDPVERIPPPGSHARPSEDHGSRLEAAVRRGQARAISGPCGDLSVPGDLASRFIYLVFFNRI